MNLIVILIIVIVIIGLLTDPIAVLTFIGAILGLIILLYGGVYIMASIIGFLGGGKFGVFLIAFFGVTAIVNMIFSSGSEDD